MRLEIIYRVFGACCGHLEMVIADGRFVYKDSTIGALGLLFSYCPFCGKEIEIEE